MTGDPVLAELAARAVELVPTAATILPITPAAAITVNLEFDGVRTTMLSVVSTFGTALDVTAAELTIETFYNVTEGDGRE